MKRTAKKKNPSGSPVFHDEVSRHLIGKLSGGKKRGGFSFLVYLPAVWLERMGFDVTVRDSKPVKLIWYKNSKVIAIKRG